MKIIDKWFVEWFIKIIIACCLLLFSHFEYLEEVEKKKISNRSILRSSSCSSISRWVAEVIVVIVVAVVLVVGE